MHLLFSLLSFSQGPGHPLGRGFSGILCLVELFCSFHDAEQLKSPMFYLEDVWMYQEMLPVRAAVTRSAMTPSMSMALSSETHLFAVGCQ